MVTPLGGSVDWNLQTQNFLADLHTVTPLGGSVDWNLDLTNAVYPLQVTPLGGSVDWNLKIIIDTYVLVKSLPLVGVWIEISLLSNLSFRSSRHSPWWECGLKFVFTINSIPCPIVTPLGGSVDWNCNSIKYNINFKESLPLVGVWIEIKTLLQNYVTKYSHSPWWECGLKLAA